MVLALDYMKRGTKHYKKRRMKYKECFSCIFKIISYSAWVCNISSKFWKAPGINLLVFYWKTEEPSQHQGRNGICRMYLVVTVKTCKWRIGLGKVIFFFFFFLILYVAPSHKYEGIAFSYRLYHIVSGFYQDCSHTQSAANTQQFTSSTISKGLLLVLLIYLFGLANK